MLTKMHYDSPVGGLTLLAREDALLGLWFNKQAHFGAKYELTDVPVGQNPVLIRVSQWLDQYFAGERPATTDLPLAPQVTDFQRLVLSILRKVPYGEVISYKQIADQVALARNGRRSAARAVGGVMGHNPISIIIPCHRVVGANGRMTGYSAGLATKMRLLALEGVPLQGERVP